MAFPKYFRFVGYPLSGVIFIDFSCVQLIRLFSSHSTNSISTSGSHSQKRALAPCHSRGYDTSLFMITHFSIRAFTSLKGVCVLHCSAVNQEAVLWTSINSYIELTHFAPIATKRIVLMIFFYLKRSKDSWINIIWSRLDAMRMKRRTPSIKS